MFLGSLPLCAPTWNRTKNSGLEVRSYIHLTMRADIVARIANLPDFEQSVIKMRLGHRWSERAWLVYWLS